MFYKTYNKNQSNKIIEDLQLNNFAELKLIKNDKKAIQDFFELHKEYDSFSLRGIKSSGDNTGSNKNRHLTKQQLLERVKFLDAFTIVGFNAIWTEHKILTGGIKISLETNGDIHIYFEGSSDNMASMRDAINAPKIFLSGSLLDKETKYKINKIAGLNSVIDYLFKYQLFNIIVEFRAYDMPVGIKNEYIIVSELRSHY